jgi:hypothetical protein
MWIKKDILFLKIIMELGEAYQEECDKWRLAEG